MTPEPIFDLWGRRVWVAGHRGMVGSAAVRRLEDEPIGQLITATSDELDLRRQADVEAFVEETRPELLILATVRVGGIQANRTRQADFMNDNVMIAANYIQATHRAGMEKVVNLGSSCMYPREVPSRCVRSIC